MSEDDVFTWQEMRIALTAFAYWLLKDEPNEGREAEFVDRFIEESRAKAAEKTAGKGKAAS